MVDTLSLFGVKSEDIKPTCLLVPFLSRGFLDILGISKMQKGNPFLATNTDNLTVVCTRMGPAFVGDAVLHLKETPCEKIIFLGACGAVNADSDFSLGALVTPVKCINAESFCSLLTHNSNATFDLESFGPNTSLIETFYQIGNSASHYRKVTGVSFGSFFLENQYQNIFLKRGIQVMDLETAAFYAAAQYIKKPALAVLYITDILNVRHVFAPLTEEENRVIYQSQSTAMESIRHLASLK